MSTTKHACGGPRWGKLTAGCPRCDELRAGAEPVRWSRDRWASPSTDYARDTYCHHADTPLGVQCRICGKYQYCD